jgi:tRNA G18 (ribose-2'-O)-methylase SpoU
MSDGILQLRGEAAIETALEEGRPLGLLLVCSEALEQGRVRALVERARAAGVPVREASASVLRRMTSICGPSPVLALLGRRPGEKLEETLARRGALWLLAGVAYPTNAGVAIRTAEGSGAAAVVIDAQFDHVQRRAALRASMRADWYMPVFWERAEPVLESARAAGHRVYAIENSGAQAPWDVDLTGPVLFVIGGEADGIAPALLERCDAVLRIPMGGFIPSYNLQIPVGVVAAERLRQRARTGSG